MEQHERVDGAPTLGAYIRQLRPGSACICCGAPLRWADGAETPRSMDWTGSAPAEARILICPDCGCVIAGNPGAKTAVRTGRALNRAA